MRLRCGLMSITTKVLNLTNEFDVRSDSHGEVSLAAVNQILCCSWGYERLQKSKDSLKACFENVNIRKWYHTGDQCRLQPSVCSLYVGSNKGSRQSIRHTLRNKALLITIAACADFFFIFCFKIYFQQKYFLMNDTNLIYSCQANFSVRIASNIKFIRQI